MIKVKRFAVDCKKKLVKGSDDNLKYHRYRHEEPFDGQSSSSFTSHIQIVQDDEPEAAILNLKEWPLYWGNISHFAADKMMIHQANGSYLLRDTSGDSAFALSVKWDDKVRHFHIDQQNGVYKFAASDICESKCLKTFMKLAIAKSLEGMLIAKRKSCFKSKLALKLQYPILRSA
ncbi:hypothetical protein HDE_11110 [Halotydeus destructor]|nr:hypothetical protein HDE_11110 [Halotydeus destructor]